MPENASAEDWARLAQLVRRRRVVELDLTASEVYARGGPAPNVLSKIGNAQRERYDARTLAKLDRALEWEPEGAVGYLRDGTEPTSTRQRGTVIAPPARLHSTEVALPDGTVLLVASSAPLTEERLSSLADELGRRVGP